MARKVPESNWLVDVPGSHGWRVMELIAGCWLITACTFSSLIWPAGSAPAALASLLFDPPEPQIIGKTQ